MIALVPHCVLNQNTVVKPLASHEGAVRGLVRVLVDEGYGIIQLPCPEAVYLGLRRWWMSREQYDTIAYRRTARKLLEPIVDLLRELIADGCRYVVIGVKGSPSCAVETTSSNPGWGGKPAVEGRTFKVEGMGVFMEELFKLLNEHGLPKPVAALDVDHREIAEKGVPEHIAVALKSISLSLAEARN